MVRVEKCENWDKIWVKIFATPEYLFHFNIFWLRLQTQELILQKMIFQKVRIKAL